MWYNIVFAPVVIFFHFNEFPSAWKVSAALNEWKMIWPHDSQFLKAPAVRFSVDYM